MSLEPSLEEFLTLPAQEIAKVAPTTLIFAAGGTRRSAALAGIELGDDFVRWNRQRMLSCCLLFFRMGIQHLIVPVARPQMFAEQGLYRNQLLSWLQWGLSGAESLNFYRENKWKARLVIAGEPISELIKTTTLLEQTGETLSKFNLWYIITPTYEQLWQWHLNILAQGIKTRTEAIKALYGDHIPPASLLVSFGKPLISLDLLPPMLYDEIQCYWMQRPSYDLDDHELRKILYDYVYLRPTWRKDKTGRAKEALKYQMAWEQGHTIGLGTHLGPFWYPADHPFEFR